MIRSFLTNSMQLKQVILLPFILLVGCSIKKTDHNKPVPVVDKINQASVLKDSVVNGLSGMWVSIRPNSFQIVEIYDSTKAAITRFEKWRNSGKDKISYEKFKGNLEVTYSRNISIHTDRFIFTYFLSKDTLFEMAEPGRVDTLLKVENGKVLEKPTPSF